MITYQPVMLYVVFKQGNSKNDIKTSRNLELGIVKVGSFSYLDRARPSDFRSDQAPAY